MEDPSVTSDSVINKQLCFDSALSPPRSATNVESKSNLDFLNGFINGKEFTKPLEELFLSLKSGAKMQEVLLMRNAKESYQRSIRAVQAAMLKHGGIATMARQYCEHQTNNDDERLKKKVAQSDLNIIKERLKMIHEKIKPLINWMSFMHQTAKNWTYWFIEDDVQSKIDTFKANATEQIGSIWFN